jgi:hypothetical protein
LAADSASTLVGQDPTSEQPRVIAFNVYNNANKVFNLSKGLPIGAVTWGAGSIGKASISTLVKDLRRRFLGTDPDWHLARQTYTVQEVAERFRQFVYEELYLPEYRDWPEKPSLGFVIAGYSANADMAEEYLLLIGGGDCVGPTALRAHDDSGLYCDGQPEAILRLVSGMDPTLPWILEHDLGVPNDQIGPVVDYLRDRLRATFLKPAMPIQDAIDLAEFLVDLTIKYARFSDGPDTVGGPIEIAAITKHEGFKWIKRKYYYDRDLNPEE